MDENIWKMTQIMMWFFGVQTTIIIAVLGGFWAAINKKFDKIDQRFDKIEGDIKDIDRRLCRIEGAMSSKDCCMLKVERNVKSAE